jgi:type IV pilus assembly protein PilW
MVSARVCLLARNLSTTAGYTDAKTYTLGNGVTVGAFSDGYKRHVYTAVIRLMNPAGAREKT